MSAVATRSVGSALRTITAAERVVDAAPALASFAIDGRTPRWVVRPATIEQLAEVMVVAAQEGLAVAPRGAGTSLDLGLPPERLDLVVDLSSLDAIVEYNPDDLTVTVQSGVSLRALNRALRAHRQTLPLDPVGADAHTVGGIAATGVSGPLRFRYGTMRDLLLGVRFVQPDGVVTWGGSKVVKSVTGYDVPKLMVGALGTLGVLAELTLRLYSLPEVERTWVVSPPSAAAAQGLLLTLLDSTLQPARIELLDEHAARACSLPPSVSLLVTFGSVEEAVTVQGGRLSVLARAAGAEAHVVSDDIWSVYDRALAVAGSTTLRIGSLPARLEPTFAAARHALARVEGARTFTSAHAGLGVWRAVIDGGAPSTIASAVAELRAAVAPHDGYVVVTGGPTAVRIAADPWGPIPSDTFALMRSIKATFDPERRLNPGRFVGGL